MQKERSMMPFWCSLFYMGLLGIMAHWIGEALPRKWFCWEKFPYRVWFWEREGKIYDRLGIRTWKDRLPDKSRVVKGMVPKKVGICPTSCLVYRLIQETCVAETVHFALCFLAFPICLFWETALGIALAWIYILCNIPFIMIQRYNRPALISLARKLEKREERRRGASSDSIGEHGRRS